jgi:hypothetical protein
LATSGAPANVNASALDSVIQGALDELQVVTITARPGMDLSAVQLALDCVSENPQCLRAVTSQHSADILVAPTLGRTSGELVLSLLRFDARSGQMRRVLRRQPGQSLGSATLDAVPDMLRELFELPPKPKPAEPVATAPPAGDTRGESSSSTWPPPGSDAAEAFPEAPAEPPSDTRVPVGPIVLAGGGVLALGAAIVLGVTVSSAQHDYDAAVSGMPTRAQVDYAQGRASTGRTNAVVANVLYGVGGAALVASGIWLALELTKGSEDTHNESVQLEPMVGPSSLGLVFTQHGAGL